MPLERTGYQLSFEEVCPGKPALGSIAVVPWDTDIFGFPVGVYRIGAEQLDGVAQKEFIERFRQGAETRSISLCACMIPANESHSSWKYYLSQAGFHFVDFSIEAELKGLPRASLPKGHSKLRLANMEDHTAIESIAMESFRNGRYHADPLFPRELADKRYGQWVKNALAAENTIDRMYVMGEPGSVKGFFHVTVEGGVSDLRLAAIAPALRGTPMGFDLYVSVLNLLKESGVQRAVTSISAINASVMSLYAMLGFRFSNPEIIFHWHRETSR